MATTPTPDSPAGPAPDPAGDAAAVFDAIGASYEEVFAETPGRRASLDQLLARLAPGSRVLDVGSGTGRPTAETLAAAGHHVTGVDVSPVMTDLATRRVPGASFVHADIRELDLPEGGYDAVCVYFALLQMPRADQTRLLGRLVRALTPGGHLALATVALDVEDLGVEFMGRPIRVTSFAADHFKTVVGGAGATPLWEQSDTFTPPLPDAVTEEHLYLVCRRTG
ncbi:class I SAM-dependent methyltransferase [Streptomyces sp. NPDC058953]|uniref:class I SAM-dependent methyltransferase n=1 Tax=unclassified Streptomyces TaxID=2593676 RepID=UPI0036B6A469